ncbi:MAG: hypothetical protein AB1324_03080 [Candidatus Micrarchaeota archaeon]
MTSNTTRKTAVSAKEGEGRSAFKGKETLTPDRLSADDIHRAMIDSHDIGCAHPERDERPVIGNIDFDHHLF